MPQEGANCFELDVHLTRDGELAVVHGRTLRDQILPTQASPGSGSWTRVEDMRLEELQALDASAHFVGAVAGGSKRIPSFGDVLHAFAATPVIVLAELKIEPPLPPPTAAMRDGPAASENLQSSAQWRARFVHNGLPRCSRSSFDHALVGELTHSILTEAAVVVATSSARPATALSRVFGTAYIIDPSRPVPASMVLDPAVNFLAPHYANLTQLAAMWAGKTHRWVCSWVIDDPATMAQQAAAGIQSITTNDVTLCRALCGGCCPPLFGRRSPRQAQFAQIKDAGCVPRSSPANTLQMLASHSDAQAAAAKSDPVAVPSARAPLLLPPPMWLLLQSMPTSCGNGARGKLR
eukprot:SM000056S17963  [mRNA]  locus=s56:301968:303521:+ [translate_table: standard]